MSRRTSRGGFASSDGTSRSRRRPAPSSGAPGTGRGGVAWAVALVGHEGCLAPLEFAKRILTPSQFAPANWLEQPSRVHRFVRETVALGCSCSFGANELDAAIQLDIR